MKILPGILNPLFLVEVTQKSFIPALIGAAGAIGGALIGKQEAPKAAAPPKVNLADEAKTAISVNQNNLKDIQDLVAKSNAFDQAEAIKLIESVVPGFSDITKQYTDLVRDDLRQLQDKSLPDELQQEILRSRISSASRVAFDYTGPGIGLGDYLVKDFGEYKPEQHKFGKVELCTFTVKFKRDIFPKFRRHFEAPTTIRIPISRAIREDLHSMMQVVRNGQYDYWAPRTKEGHSDRCTAGALATHAAGDARGNIGMVTV